MTAKGESQLMSEILSELDTLLGKFKEQDTDLAALLVTVDALVVTADAAADVLNLNIGTSVGDTITADLVALDTVCDALP